MDVFDFDNVKAEKANAILRYNRLKSIKKLFRLVEICLGLVLLSWTSSRLPFAVKISGEYFRQLISIIISPLSIFIISNVIILALLFKSRHLSPISITTQESDLYEEFVNISSENCSNFIEENPEPEEIVYEDKETILEVNTVKVSNADETDVMAGINESEKRLTKMYRKSQSEKWERESVVERSCGKLRRSKTEKCRRVVSGGEAAAEAEYVFDQLSNEEFQRAIDAFIAKQVKFHQEEQLAIVLHTQQA